MSTLEAAENISCLTPMQMRGRPRLKKAKDNLQTPSDLRKYRVELALLASVAQQRILLVR